MRQDKHLLLDEITDFIDNYGTFFVMRYKGLTSELAAGFRREVRKGGGDVQIMRKRIFLKAAEARGISFTEIPLEGHIGVIFASGDPVTMSKALIQYGKENGEAITLIGAHVERQVLTAQAVMQLSELPSKQEMQAQLLATLEAPMSQLLAVMEALVTSVVYCLDNKVKQLSGEEAPQGS